MSMRPFTVVIVMILIFLLGSQLYCEQVVSDNDIKLLFDSGILKKVVIDTHDAYVDEILWANSNIDEKKTVGYVLAHYFAQKQNINSYYTDIFGWHSGKKIATYNSWGFKIY